MNCYCILFSYPCPRLFWIILSWDFFQVIDVSYILCLSLSFHWLSWFLSNHRHGNVYRIFKSYFTWSFNPYGLSIILPFNSLYYKVFRKEDNAVRTGSASEKALTIILFMILVIVIFSCFLAISELSYGFYDIHHLISSSDNDSINETHLNDTNVSLMTRRYMLMLTWTLKVMKRKI